MGRLRNLLWITLGYLIIVELLLFAAIVYYPEFIKNIAPLVQMAKFLPVAGEMLTQVEKDGILAYVAAQHFFKGCTAFGSVAAVLYAVNSISTEAYRGTLEILLARPQSRLRILSERYAVGFLAYSLPILLTSLTAPALAQYIGEELSYKSMALLSAHEILFLLPVYSLAFLLSSVGSNPLRIAMGMLGAVLSAYALYMVKTVTHYSPLRLADVSIFVEIHKAGHLDAGLAAGFVALSLVFYLTAVRLFKRRIP